MLRPSPVPSFAANSSSSNRSISPINIHGSQQQMGFSSKERMNSNSQIQPTSNPLASVQNISKLLPPTPQSTNFQGENRLTRNASDANKFFSHHSKQNSVIDQQRLVQVNPTIIKTPPTPLAFNGDIIYQQQENQNRFNSLNGHTSPKQQTLIQEANSIPKVLQNSQSVNIILQPSTAQQIAGITKIGTTPKSSTYQFPSSTQHAKRESITYTSSVGSYQSLNYINDENQNTQQQQHEVASVQNQSTHQLEQPQNRSSIPAPLSTQDSRVQLNKTRSNSHYGGNSPSVALPTFAADQLAQFTSNTPQKIAPIQQQQQPTSLIRNRSASTINESTQGQQQPIAQHFTQIQPNNERALFSQTQPLPLNISKTVSHPPAQPQPQITQDKQGFLIHDLQQKILILLNENEKVNSVIRNKQQHIGTMEAQIKQLQTQNDDLKQECDAQTIAVRELSQTLKASQNKEQEALKQNEKQLECIKQMEKDIEEKDYLLEQIVGEREESEQKYQEVIDQKEKSYKQLLTEMEDKINMLVEENNQLNEIVQSKLMKESSISQQPYSEEQIQQIQILIQENQKLEQIITNLETQLNEHKMKLSHNEEIIKKQNEEHSTLQNSNVAVQDEFARLSDKLKQLNEENQRLHTKTEDYDDILLEAQRVHELKNENEILLENLKLVTKEKQKVQFEIQQKDETHQEEQAIILEKCAEQTNIIEEKLQSERAQFEQKQEEFIKEKEDLLIQFDKFKEENTVLAKQISEIEDKVENLIIENQELNALTQGQRDIIETLEKRQESYTEELKKQFHTSLRLKIEENLMQLTNKYNDEINKLHNEILKRNESIVEEQEKLESSEQQVNKLRIELNKALDEIKELKEFAELEDEQKFEMQKQYQQQLEFENNDLKNRIEALEQEKTALQQSVEDVNIEYAKSDQLVQEYKQQILNSDFSQGNNNAQIQQLIQTQNELIEQSLKKDSENKDLMELITNTKQEFDITIQQYQQLIDENNELKAQINASSQQNENNELQTIQNELEVVKKERDELIIVRKKQQIELSKKNKELIERKEELDHLQLKLEQSFSNHHSGSYNQIPQVNQNNSHNQQVLSISNSQKLNSSHYSNNSNMQKSNYRN